MTANEWADGMGIGGDADPAAAKDRREAVEAIQGDAYLWGIGELGPRAALCSIAEHLGIDRVCVEDALRFLPPYEDEHV